jgi:hypothetical protein
MTVLALLRSHVYCLLRLFLWSLIVSRDNGITEKSQQGSCQEEDHYVHPPFHVFLP